MLYSQKICIITSSNNLFNIQHETTKISPKFGREENIKN